MHKRRKKISRKDAKGRTRTETQKKNRVPTVRFAQKDPKITKTKLNRVKRGNDDKIFRDKITEGFAGST